MAVYWVAWWDMCAHYTHTHTHTSHLDGTGWLKLQYWFKQQLLSGLEGTGGTHGALHICLMLFAHLFSPKCACAAAAAAAALLWRKLFGPSALQIHLEFMTLTAVCFSSLERGRRMEGWREQWLMSEAAIDIGGRNKGAKKRGGGCRQSGRGLIPFPSLWPQSSLACWAFETHWTINGIMNSFHKKKTPHRPPVWKWICNTERMQSRSGRKLGGHKAAWVIPLCK